MVRVSTHMVVIDVAVKTDMFTIRQLVNVKTLTNVRLQGVVCVLERVLTRPAISNVHVQSDSNSMVLVVFVR